MIDSFSGDHDWLSNFHPAAVTLDGVEYPSVEHAYQAAKTLDPWLRDRVRLAPRAADAKRMGRGIRPRGDWEAVRLGVMLDLVRQKFQRMDLRRRLLATGDRELVEGNWWRDTFWGVCDGVGSNHLGRIVMQVRDELTRS